MTDDGGNSLILTLDDMDLTDYDNPASTVRFTMNSRAIVNGGLHPTGNGCVNQDENVTNDRWRNGSPVVQLVKRSHFTPGPAMNKLHVQQPTDLVSQMVLTNGSTVVLKHDNNNNGAIDSGAPHYEAAGGLVVDSASEFIYEGLIHWHFGGNSCYGDPTWLADLAAGTRLGPEGAATRPCSTSTAS